MAIVFTVAVRRRSRVVAHHVVGEEAVGVAERGVAVPIGKPVPVAVRAGSVDGADLVTVVDRPVLVVVDPIPAKVVRHRGRSVDREHQVERGGLGGGVGTDNHEVPAHDGKEGQPDFEQGLDPDEFAVRLACKGSRPVRIHGAERRIVRRGIRRCPWEGLFANEDVRRGRIDGVEIDELRSGGRHLGHRSAFAVLVGGGQRRRVHGTPQMANGGKQDARIHRQANKGRQPDEGQGDQDQRLSAFTFR